MNRMSIRKEGQKDETDIGHTEETNTHASNAKIIRKIQED